MSLSAIDLAAELIRFDTINREHSSFVLRDSR